MKVFDELHLTEEQLKQIQEMENLVGNNYIEGTTRNRKLNFLAYRYSNFPEEILFKNALKLYESIKDNPNDHEAERRYLAFLLLCLRRAIHDITHGLRRDYRDGIDEDGHKIGSHRVSKSAQNADTRKDNENASSNDNSGKTDATLE